MRRFGGLNSRRAKVSGSNRIRAGWMLRSRLSRGNCAPGSLCHGSVARETSLGFVRYSVRSIILSSIQCVLSMVLRGSWSFGSLDRTNSVLDSGLKGASHVSKGKALREIDGDGIAAGGNHLQKTTNEAKKVRFKLANQASRKDDAGALLLCIRFVSTNIWIDLERD